MRIRVFGLAGVVVVTLIGLAPSWGQQLSPLTGTTSTPPVTSPTVPPAPRHRSRHRFQERFESANTTHDGKLTLDQARAAHMPQIVRRFDAIDTGHKGYVTEDDVRTYRRAMAAQRRAARQQAKPMAPTE